ncbi:hypothetical protein AVEN_87479-1 [Araneus ventricosus]|uniref:Uncharacterized protein n=1 Tax=Araneus ventricosus TaxID=182803 RepID=A0A4Y2KZN9_ARAVE|nr:hypothetical protein AVEN_87479-1 [Araneus ventricosus]
MSTRVSCPPPPIFERNRKNKPPPYIIDLFIMIKLSGSSPAPTTRRISTFLKVMTKVMTSRYIKSLMPSLFFELGTSKNHCSSVHCLWVTYGYVNLVEIPQPQPQDGFRQFFFVCKVRMSKYVSKCHLFPTTLIFERNRKKHMENVWWRNVFSISFQNRWWWGQATLDDKARHHNLSNEQELSKFVRWLGLGHFYKFYP